MPKLDPNTEAGFTALAALKVEADKAHKATGCKGCGDPVVQHYEGFSRIEYPCAFTKASSYR